MKTLIWIFGRGASISCGLNWAMPDKWNRLSREEIIKNVREMLPKEIDKINIGTVPYTKLLTTLAAKTIPNWKHYFMTTNWDYLLQREIQNLNFKIKPSWLADSHVFHLNGTVQNKANELRGDLILETDSPKEVIRSLESKDAFIKSLWSQYFVLVGISFKYNIDKHLLYLFKKDEDNFPIGDSKWIIINKNEQDLEDVSNKLCETFSDVIGAIKRCTDFENWVEEMSEIHEMGAIS